MSINFLVFWIEWWNSLGATPVAFLRTFRRRCKPFPVSFHCFCIPMDWVTLPSQVPFEVIFFVIFLWSSCTRFRCSFEFIIRLKSVE